MIRLRETIERQRRRGLVLGAIALIGLVVLVTHGPAGGHDMPDMSDQDMGGAVTICLAVLEGGGILLLGIGLLERVRRARPSFAPAPAPDTPLFFEHPTAAPARARAGPATLQVFLR